MVLYTGDGVGEGGVAAHMGAQPTSRAPQNEVII